jgi:CRISPR-associated protein Cas2
MVIMVLEKVPVGLRGELSHWLVEVKCGVYVGSVSARVRDKLWEHCTKNMRAGGVFQAWNTNNEQGFGMRMAGMEGREVMDWEGVQLVLESGIEVGEVEKRRMRG